VRAEGEPGGAQQAGREEAVATAAVRFRGDVVVRARREDRVLPRLQEPPALGAALQDANLEAVAAAGIPVQVLHGADDQVVPVECGRHVKAKLPRAKLRVMDRRDHSTVVLGRERGFAEELRAFWWASRSPVHVQDAEVRRGRSGPASAFLGQALKGYRTVKRD
jgi:pimeloyl-ACP methyl ester carboxylesterase